MRTNRSLNITLPADMADLIEAKVASGAYADESAVIRDSLQALADRDATLDGWLRDEVRPVHDEVTAHPDRAILARQAREMLHAHIDSLVAKQG